MHISFSGTLDRAWLRMKVALFRPFDLGKWFVLGFTAWLATLGSSSGGSGGGGDEVSWRIQDNRDYDDLADFFASRYDSLEEFFLHSLSGLLIGLLVLLVIGLVILAVWLSSRGKFMYLDNLVHNRAEVRRPWGEFSAQGNDLFIWQLIYTIVTFVVVGGMVATTVLVFVPLAAVEASGAVFIPAALVAGTLAFMVFVALSYFWFFLDHFVVNIMYRERIGVPAAWSRFGEIFRAHPGSFVVYGLANLLLWIVGSIAFFLAGMLTCCVGLILLMIPVIGTVVTLPLHTLSRYWDLEFLGQFGDDWSLLGALPPSSGGRPGHPYEAPRGPATEPSPYTPPVTPPPAGPMPGPAADPAPEPDPSPPSEAPAEDSVELDGDGTVVGPEDVGEDGRRDEPRP